MMTRWYLHTSLSWEEPSSESRRHRHNIEAKLDQIGRSTNVDTLSCIRIEEGTYGVQTDPETFWLSIDSRLSFLPPVIILLSSSSFPIFPVRLVAAALSLWNPQKISVTWTVFRSVYVSFFFPTTSVCVIRVDHVIEINKYILVISFHL